MEFGVVFPQTEIGGDVGAVRAFAEAADGLGYEHLIAYDHVLGADKSIHTTLNGPYDITNTFHEPMVLFGFLAGITNLGFATGIMISPQRQTALLAKQAAEVDLLTGGNRLRIGIGIGWNTVEYEAMGQDFSTRAKRIEQQIPLLRKLWSEPNVTSHDDFDTVTAAGLCPMPITQPIPIWMGGGADVVLDRVGRLADGWFPMAWPGHGLEEQRAKVIAAGEAVGRDMSTFPLEGQLAWGGNVDRAMTFAEGWRSAGTTHLSINTLGAGCTTVDDHIRGLTEMATALGIA